MPKFRIYEECYVEVIYEVEAESAKAARKLWDEGSYDLLNHVGETDYERTGKIDIEELDSNA